MANSNIERDQEEQGKFGDYLINFASELSACCKALKGNIEASRDDIQADNARGALDYLMELIQEIESELPGAEEFGTKQKILAKHIQDAAEYGFSRR